MYIQTNSQSDIMHIIISFKKHKHLNFDLICFQDILAWICVYMCISFKNDHILLIKVLLQTQIYRKTKVAGYQLSFL